MFSSSLLCIRLREILSNMVNKTIVQFDLVSPTGFCITIFPNRYFMVTLNKCYFKKYFDIYIYLGKLFQFLNTKLNSNTTIRNVYLFRPTIEVQFTHLIHLTRSLTKVRNILHFRNGSLYSEFYR